MRIGIDIDDTIANTFDLVAKYALQYTRENINPNFEISNNPGKNITVLPYKEMFGWTDEQDENFWEENRFGDYLLEIKIKEDAANVIGKLYEDNEIHIITARSPEKLGEEAVDLTKKWLEMNNIKYHHLYMSAEEKIGICLENKIDLFIDDAYHHCKKMSENNIKAFMMSSEMNKGIEDDSICVVHNWKEIDEKLKEM